MLGSRISFFGIVILLFATTVTAKSLETVKIPAGELKPFWQTPAKLQMVQVSTFQTMKYPVTVAQFKSFLAKNPNWSKENVAKLFADETYLKSLAGASAKAPVTSVSWFAARAFCESHNMRLPSLFEWEYMAAASETKADANTDEKFLRRILDWY